MGTQDGTGAILVGRTEWVPVFLKHTGAGNEPGQRTEMSSLIGKSRGPDPKGPPEKGIHGLAPSALQERRSHY